MLKASLIAMFVLSLATLSFASSLMPVQASGDAAPLSIVAAPHAWIETFE